MNFRKILLALDANFSLMGFSTVSLFTLIFQPLIRVDTIYAIIADNFSGCVGGNRNL
jgi:hypothetical protein